ncbi:MAG: hypothetical protein DMD46_02635 [Gemmatimonadetes bacterium]|nr:MAG: hypothetical protein DMD46_02635 [Gemmatimonadota bacterium]
MGHPANRAEVPAAGVRTPLRGNGEGATLCPICRERPLRGAQTACSPRCRARRHRQRQDEARRARDAEVRALLLTAQESIEAARRRLED